MLVESPPHVVARDQRSMYVNVPLAVATDVPTVAATVSSTAPTPVEVLVVRPCAPLVQPTVAPPEPSYATDETAHTMPAMLADRSDGPRPEGRLDTARVSAVPPAVEPRVGETVSTVGVDAAA